MKIRKGFVTNSSSSSYVCEICNNVESGYDSSASDCGMYQCKNDHTFCQSHILVNDETPTRGDLLREINRSIANYERMIVTNPDYKAYKDYLAEAQADLDIALTCDDNSSEFNDMCQGYELDYYLPISKCPICNFDILSSSDLRRYINKKYNIDNKTIEQEVKDTFNSYDEFEAYLSSKNA
jgi:hypothetical protein